MKTVVIGFLGSSLDMRGKKGRWEVWRPTVAVCQHEDLLVSRFHLLYNRRDAALAQQVVSDIGMVSPETEVALTPLEFQNPWDFEEVFDGLLEFANQFPFDRENEEYLLHITTGTHVVQICMFLLTEAVFSRPGFSRPDRGGATSLPEASPSSTSTFPVTTASRSVSPKNRRTTIPSSNRESRPGTRLSTGSFPKSRR